MTFEGKNALITGGTRGIGRAVALKLAAEGARVTCWYHSNAESARETEALSPNITTAAVDVTQHDAVKSALRGLTENGRPVDVLVHAAGITRDTLLAGMEDDQWHAVLDANLTGAYHVCREVVREMIFQRSGRIVNLASLSGVTGLPGQTNYAASKGGLIAFTKALALETARYGLLVNAVSPGLIQTEISHSLSEERLQQMTAQIPLGRAGTPEEVAELILFLVSPRNTYITGQNLIISGGLTT